MSYIPTKAKSVGASGKYKTYGASSSARASAKAKGSISGVQPIGDSAGSRFDTGQGSTGYASSSVSEIKQGGLTLATSTKSVAVSQGVAQKLIGNNQPISLRSDVAYSVRPQSRGAQAFERGALVQGVQGRSTGIGTNLGRSNAVLSNQGFSWRNPVENYLANNKRGLGSQTVSFFKGGVKSAVYLNPFTLNPLRSASSRSSTVSLFNNDSDVKTFFSPFKRISSNVIEPYFKQGGNVFLSEVRNFNPLRITPLSTAKRRSDLMRDNPAFFVGTGLIATGVIAPATTPFIEAGIIGSGLFTTYKGIKNTDISEVGEGLFVAGTGGILGKGKRVGVEMFGKEIKGELGKDIFDITIFGNKKAQSRGVSEDLVQSDLFGKKVTARSVKESLLQFEEGRTFNKVERRMPTGFESLSTSQIRDLPFSVPSKVEVVTVAPSFLKGNTVNAGAKGIAGVEDAGTYFAPKGRANLMFTGLKNTGAESSSELSFSLKDLFVRSEPTVNRFFVRGVQEMPRSVLGERGFGGVKQTSFLEGLRDTGFLSVTKRSYVGKGDFKAQFFTPKQTIVLRTRVLEAGKFYKESGTSESEAIASVGSKFLKFDEGLRDRFAYTRINKKSVLGFDLPFSGDLIRVPKYDLLSLKKIGIEGAGQTSNSFKTADFLKQSSKDSVDSYFSNKRSSKFRGDSFGFSKSKGLSKGSSLFSSVVGSSSVVSSGSSASSILSVGSSGRSRNVSSRSGLSSGRSSLSKSRSSISSSLSSASSSFNSVSSSVASLSSGSSTSKPFYKRVANKGKKSVFSASYVVPFKTKYFASIEAVEFNIKGKAGSGAIKTGLGLRGIA